MAVLSGANGAAHDGAGGEGTDHSLRHRRDIDGLRALAILPILLLHCGVSAVRGGFVGVDVFFVISGFLITDVITRDLAAARFRYLTFLRHRIVRILPALFVMLAMVFAVGLTVLLPNQIRDLGRSSAAASVFIANLYFYRTADYFAATSDAKPLIHLWSLAVEEQFYLLYPALLVALRRLSRRRLAGVIAALALGSFAIGAVLVVRDPSAAFFLLPGRIWELSLGALVALGAAPAIRNAVLRDVVCLGALGLLVTSCLVIGIRWSFPVPFALPPALATAVLLAYGREGVTARLLGAAPLRAIGLLSYSLYLWHRPIITLYQLSYGETLEAWDSAWLLAACCLAGVLSFQLVERPAIRRWRSGRSLWPHALALGGMVAGAAAGMAAVTNADRVRPLPPELARVASYLGHDTTAAGRRQFDLDRCFSIPTRARYDLACLRLTPGRRNMALIGDSHAADVSEALRTALPDAHIVQITAAGCLPLIGAGGLPGCRFALDHGFRDVDYTRVDTVILAARWLPGDEARLGDTIRFFIARGAQVVVIGPLVEYDVELPTLIVRAAQAGDPALPARFLRADRIALDRSMARSLAGSGARYVSAVDLECPAGHCRLLTSDGAPYHFDHSHLTPESARDLMAKLIAHGALPAR